jgi:hypothetical protein
MRRLSSSINSFKPEKSHTEYGSLPPVILATLRKRMIALSAEIADGLV